MSFGALSVLCVACGAEPTTSDESTGATAEAFLGVSMVSLNTAHACGLREDLRVLCWGRNQDGELGIGYSSAFNSVPQLVPTPGIREVSAGAAFTCAVDVHGSVWCWGTNEEGELGVPSIAGSTSPVAVVGLPGRATSVAAGISSACALLEGGTVWCWGDWSIGGQTGTSTLPTPVSGVEGAATLSGHGISYCVLLPDRTVRCWGDDEYGQLGDGTTARFRSTPVAVQGLADAVKIDVGIYHVCAVRLSGVVSCWGNNLLGELGDGTLTQRTTPVDVVGLPPAVDVAVGGNAVSCAVLADETLRCWGSDYVGQLGNGLSGTIVESSPVTPAIDYVLPFGLSITLPLSGVKQVAVGQNTVCALRYGPRYTYCWGDNFDGEIGNGTSSPLPRGVPVTRPTPSFFGIR